MEKTLLEKLQNLKDNHGVELVSFFNNGKIREDDLRSARRIKEVKDYNGFEAISEVMYSATEFYIHQYDFDSIDMDLELGLIFKSEDVKDNIIKKNAKPIPGIVRFYTGSINSYLDGKQTNEADYYGLGRQSFISFKQLMATIKKSGLAYTGPETFEEFEEKILKGEPFDIKLTANLYNKEDEIDTQITKIR